MTEQKVLNKITNTFRDLLLQTTNEVGNSEEIGKDGQGGVLGYLKVAAVKERKTFLLMMARILPLKILPGLAAKMRRKFSAEIWSTLSILCLRTRTDKPPAA